MEVWRYLNYSRSPNGDVPRKYDIFFRNCLWMRSKVCGDKNTASPTPAHQGRPPDQAHCSPLDTPLYSSPHTQAGPSDVFSTLSKKNIGTSSRNIVVFESLKHLYWWRHGGIFAYTDRVARTQGQAQHWTFNAPAYWDPCVVTSGDGSGLMCAALSPANHSQMETARNTA